ncbi:MAG: hypothetical protein AAB262_02080 [Elusimicrobiota bacterium]
MEQWDEQALREINNLDAARLAIRGALATIRDLQDANAGLKGQAQDELAKRKHLESRLAQLDERLAHWQKQAEAWEAERQERERSQERWKASARSEVRAEERARIEEDRRGTEEVLARLRTDLSAMAAGQKDKEEAWSQLRLDLERRDAEIASLRRDKEDSLQRASHDLDMVEQLRTARDREIAASIRSRELELQDRANEIASLKRANEEAAKTLACVAKDQDLRLKAHEELLVKAYALKEKDLVERYQRREAELQAQWSQLEQGLWAKAKESRAQLDGAVTKQFEERSRQLAERSKEVEDLLLARRAELDEDFRRRCTEAESRYADNERRLSEGWAQKESALAARARADLEAERQALQDEWLARGKALETEHAERARSVDAARVSLEAEHKHKSRRLLEEAARKDGERVRAQDEFVSLKTAELKKAHEERLTELSERRRALEEEARAREERRQDDFLKRQAALSEEHERRRVELLEEHRRATEAETAALSAAFDQRQKTLDEEHRGKLAEAERAARALAEQYEGWKSSLRAEYLRKEKDLDARWSCREAELVRKYETALEEQRRTFACEHAHTRDQGEVGRRRAEEDCLHREQILRAESEQALSGLRDAHARDVAQRASAHESRLSELRLLHDESLRLAREKSFEDLARERAGLREDLTRLHERVQSLQSEAERKDLADSARIKSLETRLAAAEEDRRALGDEASARERDAASLRAQLAERDRLRELDRARILEECRLTAASETAKALDEAQRQSAQAFTERLAEMEKTLSARKRALENSLAERARALDQKERRLEEDLALKIQEYQAALAQSAKPS